MSMHMNSAAGNFYEGSSASTWRKSSYSLVNGGCVEVAGLLGLAVMVRDSKNPQDNVLQFAPREWKLFVGALLRR